MRTTDIYIYHSCTSSFNFIFLSRTKCLCRTPPPPLAATNRPQNPSYSSGTIAAFGLAGILFFVLVTAGLYFFVWRPRRRQRRSSVTGSLDKKFRFPNNPGTGRKKGGVWAGGTSGRPKRRVFDDIINIVGTKEIGDSFDDTECLEIRGDNMGHSRSSSAFTRWQREAVEGSTHGIALPILFKHTYSEEAISPKAEFSEAKHPYVRYSYDASRWTDRSVDTDKDHLWSDMDDRDLTSVALANLKNKGKARQITGTDSITDEVPGRGGSPIPNLLQGLHVKISSGSKNWPKLRTPGGSFSLSLNAPPSPVPGTSRRQWESDLTQVSPFYAAENPSPVGCVKGQPPVYPARIITSSPLASVPRSVSDSNSNPMNHNSSSQRESRLLLLEDDDDMIERLSSGSEPVEYPLPPPPHVHTRRNQSNVGAIQDQSFVDVLSSQAVRTLSPRTCERGGGSGIRASRLGVNLLSSEGLDDPSPKEDTWDEQATFTESEYGAPSSIHFARNVGPSLVPMPLKRASTDEAPVEEPRQQTGDAPQLEGGLTAPKKLGSPVLPSLKRTSPFDIKFDWQSVRGATLGKSGEAEGPLTSRRTSQSKGNQKPVKRLSQNDMLLRVPSREGNTGGTSRSRFRLTTSTLTSPPYRPSSHQSQMSDVVTSFIDFTSSSEGSVRSKSFRTIQSEEGTFGDLANRPPSGNRPQEPRSRWSDTSLPSRLRGSTRELPSREASSSSAEKSSSPSAVQATSESHANSRNSRRQSALTTATQSSSENVHPSVLLDLESQSESLPRRFSDTILRHNESEESPGSGSSSRRTTDSSNAFHTRLLLASRYPPLPEGTEDVASTGS